MNGSNIKKYNYYILAFVFAILFVSVYLIGTSFAWFTDDNEFQTNDDVPQVEVQLLDGNDATIVTAPSFTYTNAGPQTLVIKAAPTRNANISSIIRIMIIAVWQDGLPSMIASDLWPDAGTQGNTVKYNLNAPANWAYNSIWDIGYDYVYYNSTLPPAPELETDPLPSAEFLASIEFPTLPSQYNNKQVTFQIAIDGIQATTSGVSLWAGNAPAGWNPLS